MGMTGYGTSGAGFGVAVAPLDNVSATHDGDQSVSTIRTPKLTERRQLVGGASYDQMNSLREGGVKFAGSVSNTTSQMFGTDARQSQVSYTYKNFKKDS